MTPRTILIVDDNGPMRDILSVALNFRGYHALTAANGHDALTIAAAEPVDCILTDLDMPEMNGATLCERLRQQNIAMGRNVPVWVMTGCYRADLVARALGTGAIAVFRKPFEVTQLCLDFDRHFAKQGDHEAAATGVVQT